MNTPAPTAPPKRIVLTTFGSLGDVHPYIAIALGLQERGHDVVLATGPYYRDKIQALSINFRPIRPDQTGWEADHELSRRIMDRRTGTEFIIRELMMPALRDSYEDTLAATDGADLVVSHALTFATRLVAEKKGIRWASSLLQPLGFLSLYDLPVLAPMPYLSELRVLGPHLLRPLFRFMKWTARSWSEPWHRLRAAIGLPPAPDPLFEGQHAPALVLALFSELLGAKQPDWPPQTRVTGFPFFDRAGPAGLPPELERFLDAGPPPVVFTLGSSSAMDAGLFFEQSAAAARLLKRRAVLLTHIDPRNHPAALPEGVVAFDYAPFSELFPRAAAVVHSGGVGTIGLAMRAGRPMLVVPFAHDQPDNAARVTRLGIARTIARPRYGPGRAAAELRHLLDDPSYAEKAAEVGRRVRGEDGVRSACDALETLLQSPAATPLPVLR